MSYFGLVIMKSTTKFIGMCFIKLNNSLWRLIPWNHWFYCIYIAVFSLIICYNILLSLTAKLYVIYNSYVFIIIMIMSHFNRVKNLCLYKRTISSGLNIPNCTFLTSLKGALESAVYAIVYNRRKTITRDFLFAQNSMANHSCGLHWENCSLFILFTISGVYRYRCTGLTSHSQLSESFVCFSIRKKKRIYFWA